MSMGNGCEMIMGCADGRTDRTVRPDKVVANSSFGGIGKNCAVDLKEMSGQSINGVWPAMGSIWVMSPRRRECNNEFSKKRCSDDRRGREDL